MIDYPSKTIGRSLLYYYRSVSRIFLLQIASMGVFTAQLEILRFPH